MYEQLPQGYPPGAEYMFGMQNLRLMLADRDFDANGRLNSPGVAAGLILVRRLRGFAPFGRGGADQSRSRTVSDRTLPQTHAHAKVRPSPFEPATLNNIAGRGNHRRCNNVQSV